MLKSYIQESSLHLLNILQAIKIIPYLKFSDLQHNLFVIITTTSYLKFKLNYNYPGFVQSENYSKLFRISQ